MANRLVVKVGSTMVVVGGGLRSLNIEVFVVGPYSFDQNKKGAGSARSNDRRLLPTNKNLTHCSMRVTGGQFFHTLAGENRLDSKTFNLNMNRRLACIKLIARSRLPNSNEKAPTGLLGPI